MESVYDRRTLIFRIVLVVAYLCFGSGVFYILERAQDSVQVDDFYNRTIKILGRCSANSSEIDLIIKEIQTALLPNIVSQPWSFLSGVDIAFNAITTIGYGTTVPKTLAGRMFLIGYATIGIPLMALMLTTIGEKTKHLIRSCIISFERKVLRRIEPQNIERKCLLTVSAFTVIFLSAISCMSAFNERDWDFALAFYVWFVTFTTIGFGDYVPHGTGNLLLLPVEIVYSFGFVILGLSLIATIFHAVGDWVNSKKPPTKRSLKRSLGRIVGSLSMHTIEERTDISGDLRSDDNSFNSTVNPTVKPAVQ